MSNRESGEPIQRDPITRSSGDNVPPPESDRDVSGSADEDEELSPTDTEPGSPHGVGESIGRRGEEIKESVGKEAGREDLGTEGEAQRPVGTSDARDKTSVDPDN
jgi:hypothetical protein